MSTTTKTIPEQLADALAELSTTTAKVATLEASNKAEQEAHTKTKSDLEQANAKVAELSAALEAANKAKSDAEQKAVAAEAKAEATEKSVNERAAKMATEQMAQVGQSPAVPVEATKPTAKTESKNLFGLARVMAAFKAGKN